VPLFLAAFGEAARAGARQLRRRDGAEELDTALVALAYLAVIALVGPLLAAQPANLLFWILGTALAVAQRPPERASAGPGERGRREGGEARAAPAAAVAASR